MSIEFEYKFKPDLEKVVAGLEGTKRGLSRKVQSNSLKRALLPIVRDAKSQSPKNTGVLRKSIRARIPPLHERRRLKIHPTQGVAVVDNWGKAFKKLPDKRFHVAIFFHTPNLKRTPFNPFIHRAIKEGESKVPQEYFDALWKGIEQAMAKINTGGTTRVKDLPLWQRNYDGKV